MPVFVGAATSAFMKGDKGIGLPNLTTSARNAGVGTVTGTMILNTTTNSIQTWLGTAWVEVSNAFSASGGTEVTSGGYKYHKFLSSGTFTANATGTVEVLLVAGGGSGGPGTAGGGGAGGVLYQSVSVTPQDYTITIGGGGAGNTTGTINYNSGSNTTAFGLTAVGGGRGAGTQNGGAYPAASGGSGGGGAGYPACLLYTSDAADE